MLFNWCSHFLQTRRSDKPDAIFYLIPNSDEVDRVLRSVKKGAELSELIEVVVDWLKTKLRPQIEAAGVKFATEMKRDLELAFAQTLEQQLAECDGSYRPDDARRVHQAVLDAVQRRIDMLRSWFDGVDTNISAPVSLAQLAQATEALFENVVPDREITIETDLDDNLRGWLAFAAEKFTEVSVLATALNGSRDAVADAFTASAAALATRSTDPRVHVAAVRERLAAVTDDQLTRGDSGARFAAQQERLGLPLLPTTTIGSYPQTSAIRNARAALRSGQIDDAEYTRRMKSEIDDVIALQEDLGLDVLVHGEPERNDMVQYFAEQLDGFFATQNGWVQSYGTRCVRPPILFGDVVRPTPMAVDWITYAQSTTTKPVKGMLTGPVTILAWSFVRDDQPEKDSANQIALAIRDETIDLQRAGIGIIQVDEPALRELLPLRDADKPAYLRWAVDAFRLSTAGVEDTTQIHTHLCYSEFGEVIGAIADLDADVTSIEAARSAMEVLDDLNAIGFANGVGPGVYDIHSPRVPSTEEITASLRAALQAVPAQRLWVNPDCGLKTRGNTEVAASLRNLVAAAKAVRPVANA